MITEKTMNSTMAVNIAAAIQNHSSDYIRQKYDWLLQANLQLRGSTDESILELRGESLTLSCFFGENKESCRLSYLFPDTEKELTDCVNACNKHYHPIAANLWVNHSCNTFIRLLQDVEVGNILVFETIG